jgi:hypothetical protein
MTSALSVPLSFVAGSGEEFTNPVAVLSALRKVSDRVDIFCQAGHIKAPSDASDLLALLEPMVHQVSVKRGLFHPKIWLLEFENDDRAPLPLPVQQPQPHHRRQLGPPRPAGRRTRAGRRRRRPGQRAPGALHRRAPRTSALVKPDADRLARVRGLASRLATSAGTCPRTSTAWRSGRWAWAKSSNRARSWLTSAIRRTSSRSTTRPETQPSWAGQAGHLALPR